MRTRAGRGGIVGGCVVVGGLWVASEQADFTKDADVATRARGAVRGHFGISVRVGLVVVLLATPKEEGGEYQKGEESKNTNHDACNGAT